MKVSVITPIYNRHKFHPILQKIIEGQSYPIHEWLICEETESHTEAISGADYILVEDKLNIGQKRNLLCQRATGDIIIQIDSDDFYNSSYIERTVKLYEQDIVAHSSANMYFYRLVNQTYDLFKTTGSWGASLSYRKEVHDRIPFPNNKERGEERHFIREVKALFGNRYIETDTLLKDILVILHGNNTSTNNPTRSVDSDMKFLEDFVGKEYINLYEV